MARRRRRLGRGQDREHCGAVREDVHQGGGQVRQALQRHDLLEGSLLGPGRLMKPKGQILHHSAAETKNLQGGPSGSETQFVDLKLKVPPQFELLILKRCSNFNVN